jgi:hypothetical protein
VLPALLAGCAELLYGGDTVRVSGTVTSEGLPAVGWDIQLMPTGTPTTIYSAAETDATGAYPELVVFGLDGCDGVRVAARPPEQRGSDTGWHEETVRCGDNRVDF